MFVRWIWNYLSWRVCLWTGNLSWVPLCLCPVKAGAGFRNLLLGLSDHTAPHWLAVIVIRNVLTTCRQALSLQRFPDVCGPPQSSVQREQSVDQCGYGERKQREERPLPSLFRDAEDLDPPGSPAKLKQLASHWFRSWQGPYITPLPGKEEKRIKRSGKAKGRR